ncbi:MAG: hypothetical protein HPY71_05865 [Firmicutes bacterium]|nr:hypothetical protein [Bacillota bacterium]
MKFRLSSLIGWPWKAVAGKFRRLGAGRAIRARKATPRAVIRSSGAGGLGVIGSAPSNMDEVSVHLNGFEIFMQRWYTYDVPHEVSIFIPRAEMRTRRDRGAEETELILNTITIVHAPRFPPRRSTE